MPKVFFSSTKDAHKLPSSEEMAAFDTKTIASGIKPLELMERAGEALYAVLRDKVLHGSRTTRVVVLCGPGNNGGDGFVIARSLKRSGVPVQLILSHASKYSPELKANAEKFVHFGGEILAYPQSAEALEVASKSLSDKDLANVLEKTSIVVDALLGTGQREAPKEPVAGLIEAVKKRTSTAPLKIFSVDIPSGVSGTSGEVFEPHITAHVTATVELVKRGIYQYPARNAAGDIFTVPIGILTSGSTQFSLLRSEDVRFPSRVPYSHKGTYGRVLVLGGSVDMPGAPVLSAEAALSAGAGLVTRGELESAAWNSGNPSIMRKRVAGDTYTVKHFEEFEKLIGQSTALVLGPGLGREKGIERFVEEALLSTSTKKIPVVLDADGLNALSAIKWKSKKLPLSHCVLTPHPGEMAEFADEDITTVQANRYGTSLRMCEETGAVVVLKGPSTIVAYEGNGVVSSCDNPYLATAGSGDVLGGIIASFLAQKLSLFESAVSGVFVHAKCCERAIERRKGPITAMDLIEAIPSSIGIHIGT